MAVVAAGAPVPDNPPALETVDAVKGLRPEKQLKRGPPLCLDASSDYDDVIARMREWDPLLPLKQRREPTPEVPPKTNTLHVAAWSNARLPDITSFAAAS